MLKSYRYRLYPTKSQYRTLERQLELCRHLYNDALAYRKDAWEKDHRQVSRFETQNRLPQLKIEHPEYKEVHSLTLQNVVLRVELAFKAFFRRVKAGENPGYPRFKGRGRYDSITYPQSGFGVDSGGGQFLEVNFIRGREFSHKSGPRGLLARSKVSFGGQNHSRIAHEFWSTPRIQNFFDFMRKLCRQVAAGSRK